MTVALSSAKKSWIHFVGDANHRQIQTFLSGNPTLPKRVFNVVIEALQNVANHRAHFNSDFPDLIHVSSDGTQWTIETGNIITQSKAEQLSGLMVDLNEMDASALNQLCYQKLAAGAGGLGLPKIRKRSHNSLIYRILPVKQGYAYFYLKVTLSC